MNGDPRQAQRRRLGRAVAVTIVAIPAVWLYNYFSTKIDFLTVEMTYTSKELIDYLIKSVGSEFGRSIFTKEFQTQKAVTGSGHVAG